MKIQINNIEQHVPYIQPGRLTQH